MWNIQKLGLLGEIDHYCGVFWWKQSVASNPAYPTCTVTFSGNWNDQDVVWLYIGGSAIGKTVFGGQDNSNTIARHFANFINAIFDGVWATASGSVLTITSHSFGSVWQYHVYTALPASNTGSGQAAVTGDLQGGTYGVTWVIDPTQTPVLNRAFRDWNTDFFNQLKANNMSAVCSFSQELVQPPDNPAGGAVWVQRFPDGTAVETATGFGTLNSSQIAFSSGPQNYMAQAHAAMAGLMLAAGLTPKLQFGEILWWFQANASGMAFCDADTQAAAQSALGRALVTFHTPNDDPSVNSYADANFLRTRLYNYVAAIQSYVLSQCPSAVFELLWPMDVNDPDNCKLTAVHQPAFAMDDARGIGLRHVPHRGLSVSRDQPRSGPGDPLRAVPVDGTGLGPGALPLPDGPLLRHMAVDARVREHQPSRAAGHQALGLRPRVPVRMASPAAHERRQLVYLLKSACKQGNDPKN